MELPVYTPERRDVAGGRPRARSLADEYGALVAELQIAFPLEHRVAFERALLEPDYVRQYDECYERGRRDGFSKAIDAWIVALRAKLAAVKVFVDALAMYGEPEGTPMSAELRRRFETLGWLTELIEVVPQLASMSPAALFEAVSLVPAELVQAMRIKGSAWVRGFYALTGQPCRQGHYAGAMIGEACGDVLTAAIEEVATEAAGRVLEAGAAAGRLDDIVKTRLRPRIRKPPDADAVVEEAVAAAGITGKVAGRVLDPVRKLMVRVRERLGGSLPREIEALLETDADDILAFARRFKAPRTDKAMYGLKGQLAELMYKHMPEFSELWRDLEKRLRTIPGFEKELRFAPLVTSAEHVPAGLAPPLLSDGILYAWSHDRKRVLVLAVFESKSPTNIRDLIRERVRRGIQAWAGQIHKTFERFSMLPVMIDGQLIEAGNVVISHRATEWIAIIPKGETLNTQALVPQGFHVTAWNLPVADNDLNRTAKVILEEVATQQR